MRLHRSLGLVSGLLLGWSLSAWAVNCGDTLDGGVHTLTGDLDCFEAAGPIILTGGAVLDLQGHHIIGWPIVLEGAGATVQHGFSSGGVVAQGFGGHIISGVDCPDDEYNLGICIHLLSNGNLVERSRLGAWFETLLVSSHDNEIRENFISGDTAVVLEGDGNIFRFNIIPTALTGIIVEGDGNELSRNNIGTVEDQQGDFGLIIFGAGNRITSNFIRFYDLDLYDDAGNCEVNTYVNNDIQTADPACATNQALRVVRRSR